MLTTKWVLFRALFGSIPSSEEFHFIKIRLTNGFVWYKCKGTSNAAWSLSLVVVIVSSALPMRGLTRVRATFRSKYAWVCSGVAYFLKESARARSFGHWHAAVMLLRCFTDVNQVQWRVCTALLVLLLQASNAMLGDGHQKVSTASRIARTCGRRTGSFATCTREMVVCTVTSEWSAIWPNPWLKGRALHYAWTRTF